jgi:GntR family transcriptional regulator
MFPFTHPLDRSAGPLYRQAAAELRAAIGSGTLAVGAELPREAELAEGFGVSLITIRHALRELEGDGLILKRAAKTAVVARAVRQPQLARDVNSLEDIVTATKGARLEIIDYAPHRSAEAAEAFGVDARTPIPCLRARMMVAEGPLSVLAIFFPPHIGERMSRADFKDVVVFRSVERVLGIRPAGARITVASEVADGVLARRLDYAIGAPVLATRMLYFDATGAPVELTIARHRADRYRLTYELHDT